jgi:phosphohistidine phosphatase
MAAPAPLKRSLTPRLMRLIIVRHGLANWPSWGGTDAERPLNPDGIRMLRGQGLRLAGLGLKPDLILHSPLKRAQQTAEILAEAMAVEDRVRVWDGLRPGFNFKDLKKLLQEVADREEVMLVGHAPDVAGVVKELTGGAVRFKEGTLALVKVDELDKNPEGTLLWFIPAEVLSAV